MATTGATFTPVQQQIYLAEMRMHGKPGLAAESAGTSCEIVTAFKKHRDPDGLFANAEELALQLRSETYAWRLEKEFLEGCMEPLLGPDGKQMWVSVIDADDPSGFKKVPGWKRKLESPARLRMLERHDPSYREHKNIDVNAKSGALVVPPSFNTLDQFQEMALELKKRHSGG